MTTQVGRPLRFLVAVVGGWALVRVVWLWPDAAAMPEPAATADQARARILAGLPLVESRAPRSLILAALPVSPPAALARPEPDPLVAIPYRVGTPAADPAIVVTARRTRLPDPTRVALALAAFVDYGPAIPVLPAPGTAFPGIAPGPSRWSATAWSIVRGGRSTPFAPQLGGSQAGARVVYALDDRQRFGVGARLSSALASRQNEGAVGVSMRAAAPITLFAERRLGLGGIRGGYAAGAIAGIAATPVAAGFDLEAYAQAGAIARGRTGDGVEGFGDGAARLTRSLATIGAVRVAAGAGAWGGAQRGVRRVDLGPSLTLGVPAAGRTLRFAVDWRQRVAGNGAPASGPALSLGTDF